MKKTSLFLSIGLILAVGSSVSGDQKAPPKLVELAKTKLAELGTDPIIVKAVKEENAKAKTLVQIKETDKQYRSTPGISPFIKSLMENECAKYLREFLKSAPYYAEIYVMDNQGAIVAMVDKEEEYWKGKEDEFTDCYQGGAGALFISEVEFDNSAQCYMVEVSVPVKDGAKTIGVLTIGIDLDKFK